MAEKAPLGVKVIPIRLEIDLNVPDSGAKVHYIVELKTGTYHDNIAAGMTVVNDTTTVQLIDNLNAHITNTVRSELGLSDKDAPAPKEEDL